jgi:1-acyl-sn-glycerol-3-phosphate acyltransferase
MRLFECLRVIYRAPLALLWTLLVHWFAVRLPQILVSRRRYLRPIGIWGRGLAAIMGVRIHRRNERAWPMGEVIIANHMGFLDVPVLLSFFPAVFVIKMEMRRVLYFGGALARQGHVFVDRADRDSKSRAGGELRGVLEDGDRIIVFPEGRASPGAKRLPFRRGSFAAAQQAGKRIEVCVIDYLPDRRSVEWDASKPMLPQLVRLLGRARTDVSVEFFPSEMIDGDPAAVADRWHDVVQGRLEAYDREREDGRRRLQELGYLR